MSSTAAGSPTGSTRTPEVRVRPATLDDAEAIERIRVETWRATYRGLLPDGLIDGLRENAVGRGFYERLGGRAIREKPLEEFPGAADHIEIGYGWSDTSPLR